MLIPAEIINHEGNSISFRKIGKGPRRILFFHGFPGSSIQLEAFRPLLESKNLQVICVDRPGYNGTEVINDQQFAWTKQTVRIILQKFEWSQFEVVSVSGGTPFLFDFVRSYSEMVSHVTIISGLGPIGRQEYRKLLGWRMNFAIPLVLKIPGHWLRRMIVKSAIQVKKAEQWNLFRFFMPISMADEVVMRNLQTKNTMMQSLMEALQQNGLGPKRDLEAYLQFKDISLGKYSGNIKIWHGTEDRILPPKMAKMIAEELPSAQLNIIPNEGHYSLIIDRIAEIII